MALDKDQAAYNAAYNFGMSLLCFQQIVGVGTSEDTIFVYLSVKKYRPAWLN